MDDKQQKINCTVESCEYNDTQTNKCELDQITVEPCSDYETGEPEDETLCGSYKQHDDEDTWE